MLTPGLYLGILRQSFLNALAYRANMYAGLAREFLFLYLSVSLWRALYQTGVPTAEATMAQVVAYIAVGRVLGVARAVDLRPLLEHRIISGDIAGDLIRPYDYPSYLLFRAAGSALFNFVLRAFPMFGVVSFMWRIPRPPLDLAVVFLASALLAFLVSFFLDFLVGMLAFWTTEMWSFSTIKFALIALLSGALIPLWFFPPGLGAILEWLPFAAVVYVPASIFAGVQTTAPIAELMARQAMWVLLLFGLSRLMWRQAVSRLAVQGG